MHTRYSSAIHSSQVARPKARVAFQKAVAAIEENWFASSAQISGLREAMRTMNAYSLWFLNRYLKGSPDPMPALANYPRIINFKQK